MLVYANQRTTLERFKEEVTATLGAIGSVVAHATYIKDTEHFGFRDGLSNPVIRGARQTLNPQQIEPGGLVAPGEFLFGYADERGKLAVSPQIPQSDDPDHKLPLAAPAFIVSSNHGNALARDFGRNGSFLVVMELQQDVASFNDYLKQEELASGGAISADKLGAQMMGRWKNGTPVTLSPDTEVNYSSSAALKYSNNFGYADLDSNGDSCPRGAHIRRSNPRDTIHKDKAISWQFANRHRILRRGRLYGSEAEANGTNPAADTGSTQDRGILFMCLNISLGRQFEHVQRNWISNVRFGRVGETDPIAGSRQFSNREFTRSTLCPHQTHKSLPNFVNLNGGGYFFLPGLTALSVIAGK